MDLFTGDTAAHAHEPLPESRPSGLTGIAAMAASSELALAPRDVECFDLPCRKVLNRCSSPRMPFDFTINPYRGCELSCVYCYARYTHEFLQLTPSRDFERKIYAKRGAARALARELVRHDRSRSIAIGTATDPYQPLERRLELTRSILDELARHEGLSLHVTTKSDLVVRDLDLMREIARRNDFSVNLTITTLDDELARALEPRAPVPSRRVEAIRALSAGGIETHLLLAPILPWITDSTESLERVLRAARQAGARAVHAQVLFLPEATRPTFFEWLERMRPGLVPRYRALYERSNYLSRSFTEPILERVRRIERAIGFPGERAREPSDDAGPTGPGALPDVPGKGQLPLFGR
jgi:DNA repair photolyase